MPPDAQQRRMHGGLHAIGSSHPLRPLRGRVEHSVVVQRLLVDRRVVQLEVLVQLGLVREAKVALSAAKTRVDVFLVGLGHPLDGILRILHPLLAPVLVFVELVLHQAGQRLDGMVAAGLGADVPRLLGFYRLRLALLVGSRAPRLLLRLGGDGIAEIDKVATGVKLLEHGDLEDADGDLITRPMHDLAAVRRRRRRDGGHCGGGGGGGSGGGGGGGGGVSVGDV
mmetsp:Transcript_58613/g.139459  ORF Transcript_58613/g.139459 Transcript_58613/m.139459 type:complete len:225 (+) Transcript_58613:43-717(+)